MIDLDLFFDIPRDVAMATDFVQKWGKIAYPPALIIVILLCAIVECSYVGKPAVIASCNIQQSCKYFSTLKELHATVAHETTALRAD